MKIAIIVSTFPPYHGGMGNVAEDQARELSRLGHEVTVMTPVAHRAHAPTRVEPFRVEHFIPLLRWGNAASIPGIVRRFRKFDAIMLHYPFFGTAELFIIRQIRRMCKKLILVYHMDLVGRGALGKFFQWHARALLPHIFHHSDVIAVSSLDYALSGVLGTMPDNIRKKLVEFPIGVDTARFFPGNKEEARRRLSIPAGARVALFVGGLDRAHYFKGVSVLLNAWKELSLRAKRSNLGGVGIASSPRVPPPLAGQVGTPRNDILLVAGEGDLREQYEARARGLGIADRVRFMGRIADDDLPDLYRAADVLVLPSIDRSEAFGKVLLEAQACGLPVIASNLPGVRTTLKSGETGLLVPPNDSTALADAIRSVLDDPARTASMGRAAREWIESRYSWISLASKFSHLLN